MTIGFHVLTGSVRSSAQRWQKTANSGYLTGTTERPEAAIQSMTDAVPAEFVCVGRFYVSGERSLLAKQDAPLRAFAELVGIVCFVMRMQLKSFRFNCVECDTLIMAQLA